MRAAVAIAAGASVRWLIEAPAITLAIYFTLAFVLQMLGAVSRDPENHLQLDVNPWFAWLLCGGLVVFFVGLLAAGHQEGAVALRTGALSAAVWVFGVALVWATSKLARRGA